MRDRIHVGVIGPQTATPEIEELAVRVGRGIAERGGVVVCGGLTGVMAAACRGAKDADGTTIGLLPGLDRHQANEWVDVALPTGLGEVRNVLVVRASDAIVAVDGSHGTLTEIAFALKHRKPVVALRSWTVTAGGADGPDAGITIAGTAEDAVDAALRAAGRADPHPPSRA